MKPNTIRLIGMSVVLGCLATCIGHCQTVEYSDAVSRQVMVSAAGPSDIVDALSREVTLANTYREPANDANSRQSDAGPGQLLGIGCDERLAHRGRFDAVNGHKHDPFEHRA